MEALPGCRVTVVRKDNGPIAARHGGVQISMAVARPYPLSDRSQLTGPARGLHELAGKRDHQQHHLPAAYQPGGVGCTGVPRASGEVRGVAKPTSPV